MCDGIDYWSRREIARVDSMRHILPISLLFTILGGVVVFMTNSLFAGFAVLSIPVILSVYCAHSFEKHWDEVYREENRKRK